MMADSCGAFTILMRNRTIVQRTAIYAAMIAVSFAAAAILALAGSSNNFSSADWPAWRGPTPGGISASGQKPPTQSRESENIVWKTPRPGPGHGLPPQVVDPLSLSS